ncbi:kinase-like domain-containing protein, partial [Blastocladiella britannica]
ALAYMHDRNIVHRDLKLENILLVSRTRPYTIKLSDFGMSMILPSADTRIDSRCGSEEYAAPELIMLTGSAFAPKPADMWAAGVILYAL